MKRQYLGDSKDSFKWDYHDYLMQHVPFAQFQIVWMMTPNDRKTHGSSDPKLYPARNETLELCYRLKAQPDPSSVLSLPKRTSGIYRVLSYKPDEHFTMRNRTRYFSELSLASNQLIFFDPDNGFKPGKCTEAHLKYEEIDEVLERLPPSSAISIFQIHRRKSFETDFDAIQKRLVRGLGTAIYWHSLMFVCISLSPGLMKKIEEANEAYRQNRPVKTLRSTGDGGFRGAYFQHSSKNREH